MYIDIALIVLILLFGLLGLFQGVVIQLFRLGGLVAIYFYARFAAEAVGQWLSQMSGLNPVASYGISLIVGSALVYMVCSVTGLIMHRIVTGAGETPRKINRSLGGSLGLLRGVLVAFIIAAAFDMLAPAAEAKEMNVLHEQIEASLAVQWVHVMNPLMDLGILSDIPKISVISHDPDAMKYLKEQPVVHRLENHRRVQAALKDEEVNELARDGRWWNLLSHPKVSPLFYDDEIHEIVNSREMRQAIDEALRRAKKDKQQGEDKGQGDKGTTGQR